jgi:hypothetical protein
VGIIHKRLNEFATAERYFKLALDRFQQGQRFLTDRGETNIRFELATAIDGQGKTGTALQAYQDLARSTAMTTDSYHEMLVSYELARLNLKVWLRDPTVENLKHLDASAEGWDFWLARDWQKQSSKLWAFYHAACTQKELLAQAPLRGHPTARHNTSYEQYATEFRDLARKQKGVKRYEVRFTAFFLESPDYEEFPAEPLKCGLGDLLKEFQIR